MTHNGAREGSTKFTETHGAYRGLDPQKSAEV